MLEYSKTFPTKKTSVNLKKNYGIAGTFYSIFGRMRRFTV